MGDLANVRPASAPLKHGEKHAQTEMPMPLTRALVVDDNLANRRLIIPALHERHFEVTEASDFIEALSFVSHNSVDLVVAELRLSQRPDPINLSWLIRVGAFGTAPPPLILYLDTSLVGPIDVTGPMAEAFIIPAPLTINELEDALEAAMARQVLSSVDNR